MAAKGPLEILVLGFPGEGLPDGAGLALERMQEDGDVRVVEAVLVVKTAPGTVRSEEVTDLVAVAELAAGYGLTDLPSGGLMSPERVREIGVAMQVDTTALALVLEHRWARDIVAGFRAVGGIVLGSSMVPEPPRPTRRYRITGTGG